MMKSFKFGLITDTHYANRQMRIGRYYRNALQKTRFCMDVFRRENVDFCVHLGDIIDWPNQPEKGSKALDTILPVLNSLDVPMYYVLGNHDLASVTCDTMRELLNMDDGKTWYSFDYEGLHFIVLDCNFDADEAWYRPDNSQWDQCYIPSAELSWLETDLRISNAHAVVVFVHALLDDLDNPHVIRNAGTVRALLENCGKQMVVFQGHMHCGHESEINGIGYHTMKSIVNGRSRTCYWVVEVTANGIFVDQYDSTVNHGKAKRKMVLKFGEQFRTKQNH